MRAQFGSGEFGRRVKDGYPTWCKRNKITLSIHPRFSKRVGLAVRFTELIPSFFRNKRLE